MCGVRVGGWPLVYNPARFFQCSSTGSSCMGYFIPAAGIGTDLLLWRLLRTTCFEARVLDWSIGYPSVAFVLADELFAFQLRRRKL
jgi:hypothetical protein